MGENVDKGAEGWVGGAREGAVDQPLWEAGPMAGSQSARNWPSVPSPISPPCRPPCEKCACRAVCGGRSKSAANPSICCKTVNVL